MASSDNENHAFNLVNDQETIEEIEELAATTEEEKGGGEESNLNLAPEEDKYWRYIELQKAALRGDWETAKKFFDQDAALTGARITPELETPLHIAVESGMSNDFVEKLVGLIPADALGRRNISGCTALHNAACVGNTMATLILVGKNSALLYIRDEMNWLPIHWAANQGHKETLLYLLSVTEDDPASKPFAGPSGAQLLYQVVGSKFHDVALSLVSRYPHLARSQLDDGDSALRQLAYQASSFPSGTRLNSLGRLIYPYVPVKLESYVKQDHDRSDIENPINNSQVIVQKYSWVGFLRDQKLQVVLWNALQLLVPSIKYIQEKKLMHLQALQLLKCLCGKIRYSNDLEAFASFYKGPILTATKLGIQEVVEEIVESYPKAIMLSDSKSHNIFELAVIHRCENIFNLVYQTSQCKQHILCRMDNSRNTILHLVGRLAPPDKLNLITSAALQMQRELQWFKEVEKFVPHSYKERLNKDEKTPAMIFIEEHAELVKEGAKWMKETASSFAIPAALIATIAFAAAITVPGGNNGANGLPIFFKEKAFIIFLVSDAISLFTSTTYLLIFLSILTSRFALDDFLYVLPNKLIIGLLTIYISILAMLIAFSSTLYLVLDHNKAWILIPIATFVYLLVFVFLFFQFPLLAEMMHSTYDRGILRR